MFIYQVPFDPTRSVGWNATSWILQDIILENGGYVIYLLMQNHLILLLKFPMVPFLMVLDFPIREVHSIGFNL